MKIDWLGLSIFIGLACLGGAIVLLVIGGMFMPIQAASDIPPCEAINTAGNITVYRCVPEQGPSYLVNSVGFMVFEDW